MRDKHSSSSKECFFILQIMAPTIAIITTNSASAPIATSTSNPKQTPGFDGNNVYSIYNNFNKFKRKFHIETHILLYDKVNQYYTYFTINNSIGFITMFN